MRVRPFADDDLSLPFLGTIPFRADRWRDAHTHSAVLEIDGRPVGAGLDLEASSAATVDGDIVALSLVYRDSTPPILTAETTSRAASDGERLVEASVRRSLDVLAGRGIDLVTFDGHVTDPHFLPVWARLAPAGRWFRLVEIPPAGGGG